MQVEARTYDSCMPNCTETVMAWTRRSLFESRCCWSTRFVREQAAVQTTSLSPHNRRDGQIRAEWTQLESERVGRCKERPRLGFCLESACGGMPDHASTQSGTICAFSVEFMFDRRVHH
eukprot:361940-Chlamydomonas_euryale.AAC.5